MQKTTKFYEFWQDNPGGWFDYDEDQGISVNVFVEAHSAEEANRIAEDIGLYFDGIEDGSDCSCCGARWYKASDYDAVDNPPDAAAYDGIRWVDGYHTFVHYLDGQIVGMHK